MCNLPLLVSGKFMKRKDYDKGKTFLRKGRRKNEEPTLS